jgi:hypothetical protein
MAICEAGDCVKVELTDEATGESEWLWVRVVRCDDANRLVFGKLDSQPVIFPGELELGQDLACALSDSG